MNVFLEGGWRVTIFKTNIVFSNGAFLQADCFEVAVHAGL